MTRHRHIIKSNKTRKVRKISSQIPSSSQEITAIIDANAIKENIKYLRHASKTDVMPVLKANAYGHGIVDVAKICRSCDVKYIGVATIGEALLLRNNGDKGHILAWLYCINNPELKTAILQDIDIAIFDESHIDKIIKLVPNNKKCRVHLHIETGINRTGTPYEKTVEIAKKIMAEKKLQLVGMMSHLIESELIHNKTTIKQLTLFREMRQKLADNNIFPEYIHIANSGACLNYDVSDFTIARPGLAIYGLSPSGKPDKNLHPAMKLVSKIIQIKNVKKGDTISYDSTYKVKKNMNICIIPIGYADIIPRASSNKLYVIINNTLRKVLGRVCMDQIVVESKNIDKDGDEVILFDNDKKIRGGKDLMYTTANESRTIVDEIAVRVGYRVSHKYINL